MSKNFARTTLPIMLAASLILMTLAFGAGAVRAASVTPTVIPGADNTNKTCAVVMPGTIELKIEPVNAPGTTKSDGYLSVTIVVPSTAGTPNSFDWTSNHKVLGVIVKNGADGANFYDYRPAGSTGDTNLQTPFNGDKGISHISFCYRPALTVTKDATTTFTRTFTWDIDKSVVPDTWDLFTGDSGTSEYTVTVTKDAGTDSDWAVSGNITIHNPHPTLSATITGVTDSVNGTAATVNCPGGFPQALAPGGTLTCTYSASLSDGSNRTNTATVTTSGTFDGGTGTAAVTFGSPTTVKDEEVTVSDTNADFGGPFTVDGNMTWNYSRTFTCDDDEGTHNNTASFVTNDTGATGNDSASVEVNCYELAVEKDADTSLTRKWTWTIDKSADQTDLTLSEGQLFQVNYEVKVDATSADSEHAVSGNITVDNPAPIDATINSVSDIVSPNIAADVDCNVTFPYTLAAGDTLNCTYSADLPDDEDRTNTATATRQNYDYDSEGNATATDTTDVSFTANVSFTNATVNEVDECIDVSDTNAAFGGPHTVCAGVDTLPATFNYSLWFGAHPDADVVLECGNNTHTNVADFVTNDTGATGDDDHTVNAEVACALGCTLTQGYWKTHSEFGPAPYDDTWAQLPNGASTTFFLSGKTYYEVLWTPPAGNAYYNLAHQYIAAQLNILNGADPSAIQSAFNSATTLFNTYTPAQVAALKPNDPVRKQFISLAATLDKYNNGLIGPGHCSE